MTEPQEFSSDFDKWVGSLLDMLRAKGYTNVSVNRGSKDCTFFYCMWVLSTYGSNYRIKNVSIPYTQLQADFSNKQTPKQILDLIN